MPLTSLYTLPRDILANQRKERKAFLQAHNWELDRFPLLKRLWWRHLLWPCHLVTRTCSGLVQLFAIDCAERYCIVADRLFGGSRCQRFSETVNGKIAAIEEKNRQARKRFEAGLIRSTQMWLSLEEMKQKKPNLPRIVN
ncbi:MAG: hypothetical protein ROO76_07315 [Terriglobia bacterium]|nr:hypothetical protein [Terriglobia bacterium]